MTRAIFLEYADTLAVDLRCFQNFEHEVSNLPGEYAHPRGTLLLVGIPEQRDQ